MNTSTKKKQVIVIGVKARESIVYNATNVKLGCMSNRVVVADYAKIVILLHINTNVKKDVDALNMMTNKQYYAKVGEQIRSARTMSGLSQQELASLIGIRRDVLAGYERGLKAVSLIRFHNICQQLGVAVEKVLESLEVPEELPNNDGRFVD